MAIQELVSLISPPDRPLETGTQDKWETLQKDLSIRLPSDYFEFGMVYGSGYFEDERSGQLRIYQPFWSKFRETLDWSVANLSASREYEGEEYVPFPIFPEIPGLFIWASDVHGNDFFWHTEGEPDEWQIVVGGRDGEWDKHDGPMTSFLARAFTRQIDVHVWPEPFFADPSKIVFTPTKEYS
ncbi:MAG: SMI1/KNR4 family protein [Planctomycetaceae bacterium]